MSVKIQTPNTGTTDDRHHYIPIRKSDLLEALSRRFDASSASDHDKFLQVCKLLGSLFHYEYFEKLEQLRDEYYYFDPERVPGFRAEAVNSVASYERLVGNLQVALKAANYVEIPRRDVEASEQHSPLMKIVASTDDYRDIRIFRRGQHKESVDAGRWLGLRNKIVETWFYDNVVILVAVKQPEELESHRQRRRLKRGKLRTGSVLIKYFRNIPFSDVKLLYPRVHVKLSMLDKMVIAIPFVAGGTTLLLNLLPTLSVLFVVAGFYLGYEHAIDKEDVPKAVAALSGVGALGGLVMRQRLKYERRSLKYQKQISDNFYFRNISNNAGLFDYIVGAAEEQECKEAFLAYYFLLTSTAPLNEEALDKTVETWLLDTFGIDIDFEVDDALAKLERLNILQRDGDILHVPGLDDALIALDKIWDNFFMYNNDAEAAARASLVVGSAVHA